MVKIFAENEWGEHRCVCSFLSHYKVGRVLSSPFEAARFVSLMPFRRKESIGGGRDETWHSLFTSITIGRLDCEDHAVLLASLLLGFGLDAYVVVGTMDDDEGGEKDHVWVMTRPGKRDHKTIFWESLTGHRYTHDPSDPDHRLHPYKRVGCVFNDKTFYANKHPSDAVETCLFELGEEGLWKGMEHRLIEALPHQLHVPLAAPTMNTDDICDFIERRIKQMITSRRRNVSLTTSFDDSLSYILSPALDAYEMERLTGVSIGNEEFQQSVKNAVPQGHSFKGYPIMFNSTAIDPILSSLEEGAVSSDIISTVGDRCAFAVRAKVKAFPENVCAVWVMIAVKFRPMMKMH
jgi:centrosomal protein CEP76